MPSSPYEWNESIRQRNEYIEDRLRDGSPVVGVSIDAGIVLLCLRQTQRKIYEIYDRLAFTAIGNQADIETIRTGAIDVAHREGFTRSPDDVSIQRIVGFAVSPSIKKIYGDAFAAPVVVRGLFAELGKTYEQDQFFTITYDGEFSSSHLAAAIAGTSYAEERSLKSINESRAAGLETLTDALKALVRAWAIGLIHIENSEREEGELPEDSETDEHIAAFVADHLAKGWHAEAAILERHVSRENRYRSVTASELAAALSTPG